MTNERLEKGVRCLCGADGYWAPGTIHRVNEDGTFTIAHEDASMMLMPYVHGVPADQISANDEALWPDIFAQLAGARNAMDRDAFEAALTRLGLQFDASQLATFWSEQCKSLFDEAKVTLDSSQAYRLFLAAGCCAKQFTPEAGKATEYFKLYWNMTRMGGRHPDDLPRPVTLDDALLAIGLPEPKRNASAERALEAFQEQNAVELPDALIRLFASRGVQEAVLDSHPNNPSLVLPGEPDCRVTRELPDDVDGKIAWTLMTPHQGDHIWRAVLGEADVTVYVTWDEAPWLRTAPSVEMFLWDLAQTGLGWFQTTGHDGGRPITQTDLGAAPVRDP